MTAKQHREYLLAGDIGGTKTSLALYDSATAPLAPIAEQTVPNEAYPGVEDIIERFLAGLPARPRTACFGVAGPISDNRVRMTNLPWTLHALTLQQQFGLERVTLINDMVATAMGTVHLPAENLHTLNHGQPDPVGAIALIAPGTGLGEAFLLRHHGRFSPYPSEGGHASFAPVDEEQIRLLRFLSLRQGHVSTEQACSGRAIPDLYDFLCGERGTDLHPLGADPQQPDRTGAIVAAALAGGTGGETAQNIATATLRLFCSILAAEAANLVLKVLATGGLYIGGGIPPRILPFLHSDAFMSHFCRGVYKDMLATVPVHVILEPKTALIGAAAYGMALLATR